ncbi:MAG: CoA ester lyase [Rhodobacteraceae bacterium]|nr:CoA ester lyase [Paracoccaceae bacterium]
MFPLFVPATRPDRIEKARVCGASFVIADLEDAVAPGDKETARNTLAELQLGESGAPVCVRINGVGTPWFEEDLAMVAKSSFAGLVLPKAEDSKQLNVIHHALPPEMVFFGIVETALGLGCVRDLAPQLDRLFFGSLDYAADLDCAHTIPALAHARAEIVLAARMAQKPGPLDGVTADTKNLDLIEKEAAYGSELGFKGKLLIHPAQLSPAMAGFRPSDDELAWAMKVQGTIDDAGVAKVDGEMVDAPVIARAKLLLARAAEASPKNTDKTSEE